MAAEHIAQAVDAFRLAAEALQLAIRALNAATDTSDSFWSCGHIQVYQVNPSWERFRRAKRRVRNLQPFRRGDVVRRIDTTEAITVRTARINRPGNGWYVITERHNGKTGACGQADLFELAIGTPDLGPCTWTHRDLCDATYDTLPEGVMDYAIALDRAEANASRSEAA